MIVNIQINEEHQWLYEKILDQHRKIIQKIKNKYKKLELKKLEFKKESQIILKNKNKLNNL